MQNLKLIKKVTALATIALLLSLSGCAAKYHTIRKSQGGENESSKEGDDATPTGQAPSAQVEVVLDGKLVVKVKAGSTFVIRPTESTMDPDDRDNKDCRNPGITKATYKPGQDGEKISSRSGCEKLDIEHSFAVPGMYEISMTVTSNENESASSKMMLEVTPSDSPEDQTEGGFVVTATPLISEVGEPITFKSDCTGGVKITWDYRDQSTGEGTQTNKIYNTPGQYVVLASCDTDKSETLTGQITVVVVPKKTTPSTPPTDKDPVPGTDKPGDLDKDDDKPNDKPTDKPTTKPAAPTKPTTPDNDDDKPGNHPGKPGQNPNQNPGQTVFQG